MIHWKLDLALVGFFLCLPLHVFVLDHLLKSLLSKFAMICMILLGLPKVYNECAWNVQVFCVTSVQSELSFTSVDVKVAEGNK